MGESDPNMQRAQARVGTWLRGKWHLDRLIGLGGMAAVYAATHRNHQRGAVKLLHLELAMDPTARARFLREGYVANKVGHPGAVRVLDDDVNDDGTVYLVMELLEGQPVEKIAESRPSRCLSWDEVLGVADQLLDVLAAAHAAGIVHRDLKPENLFLTRENQIKVLDFGIARLHDATSARGTRTGEAFGTPAFMPPEQALGEWSRVDGRTDLWAVGATMFTLLTGRLVHEAESLQKLMLAAMTKPAPPLGSILPGLPKEIAAIVDRALAFRPEDRWPNARAMQQAVRRAREALPRSGQGQGLAPAPPVTAQPPATAVTAPNETVGPVSTAPTLLLPSRRPRWRLAAGALAAALVAAGVAFVALRAPGAEPSSGHTALSAAAPGQAPSAAEPGQPLSADPTAAPAPTVTPPPEPSAAGSAQPASSGTAVAAAAASTPAPSAAPGPRPAPPKPKPKPTTNLYDKRQ